MTGGAILETTRGTGLLTEHLWRRSVDKVSIVAMDVSEPMLEVAASRRGQLEGVRYQQAVAEALREGFGGDHLRLPMRALVVTAERALG